MALKDILEKDIQTYLSDDEKNFYGLLEKFDQEQQKISSSFAIKSFQIIQSTITGAEDVDIDQLEIRVVRLSNLKKYVSASKLGDQEEKIILDNIKIAEDALKKQLKNKKSFFKNASKSITASSFNLAAGITAITGGDPLVALGMKLVGDIFSGRKERKIQKQREKRNTLRSDTESLKEADSSPAPEAFNEPTFSSPSELLSPQDSQLSQVDTRGGKDRIYDILQDIFLYTEETSHDIKKILKELTISRENSESESDKLALANKEAALEGIQLSTASTGNESKSSKKGGLLGNMIQSAIDGLKTALFGSIVGGGAIAGTLSGIFMGAITAAGGLLAKGASLVGGASGPLAIAAGLIWAAMDGIAGFFKSDEWGVSEISGTIGSIFAGTGEGIKNAFANAGKWALMGAGLGLVGGPIGALIGGMIGALLGGLLGYVGGEKVAETIDNIGFFISDIFGTIGNFIQESFYIIEDIIDKSFDIYDSIKSSIVTFMMDTLKWIVDKDRTGVSEKLFGSTIQNLGTELNATKIEKSKRNKAREERHKQRDEWRQETEQENQKKQKERTERQQKTDKLKQAGSLDENSMQGKVLKELEAQGITDTKEQANILANIQAESNFKPQSENLNYSPETLMRLFGPGSGNKVRVKTIEEAQSIVSQGPEAVGNLIYGGRMGNAPDEGFKYRGRGLVQLTGKENYATMSKKLGVDLLSNPDLANDPEIAAKIQAQYYADRKKTGKFDFTNIRHVAAATGHAGGAAETEKRAMLAKQFEGVMSRGNILNDINKTAQSVDSVRGTTIINNIKGGNSVVNSSNSGDSASGSSDLSTTTGGRSAATLFS